MALSGWLLGCFTVANVYLSPGSSNSPRMLDLLGPLLWGWLLWRLAGHGIRTGPLVLLLVLNMVPLGWSLYAMSQGLRTTLFMSLRWLLAIPVGYALSLLAEHPVSRRSLVWGLWWGLVVNVAVLAIQYVGGQDLTMRLGLAAQDSDIVSIERIFFRDPGMHGHANASAAVASLIIPVGLYLYYRGWAGALVPAVSVGLLLVSGHVTSTRSPLLVSAVGWAVAALTSRRFLRTLGLVVLAGLLLGPSWYYLGPPGGRIRWADTAHMSANTNERLASNRAAIQLTLEHPLGMGVEDSQETLLDELENPATHNAFLQMGVVYGPLQASLVLLLVVLMAWPVFKGIAGPWGLEAYLGLHLFGLFLFEEHLNNPTFIVLIAYLAAASVRRLGGAASPDPIAVPMHSP